MDEDSKTNVCAARVTSVFSNIKVGVHQGSTSSVLLFVFVQEEVSKQLPRGDVWEMFYADDLVLAGEITQEVEELFACWKETTKIRGLRVNIGRTKLIDRDLSKCFRACTTGQILLWFVW